MGGRERESVGLLLQESEGDDRCSDNRNSRYRDIDVRDAWHAEGIRVASNAAWTLPCRPLNLRFYLNEWKAIGRYWVGK